MARRAVPDSEDGSVADESLITRAPQLDANDDDALSDSPVLDDRPPRLEDEISEGPAANWEVAYVYAFLERFTELVNPEEPLFPSVMTLEQALLDSSPFPPPPSVANAPPTGGAENTRSKVVKPFSQLPGPSAGYNGNASNGNGKTAGGKKDNSKKRAESPASSLSSLSASESDMKDAKPSDYPFNDPFEALANSAPVLRASAEPVEPVPPFPLLNDDGTPVPVQTPPSNELIKTIMLELIEILSSLKELTDYHGKKTWFHFLINFVTFRLGDKDGWRGGFRWETNLLRTRGLKPGQENEEKFWNLRWEDKVHLMRQMIDFMLFGTADVRDTIKQHYDLGNQRIAKRDPDSNPLVLLPLGRTSSLLTIYHLDTSPRLYASGSPYKASSPWVVVASTLEGYRGFLETLAEPSKADRKQVKLKGPFARAASWAMPGASIGPPAGGRKGKGKEQEGDGKEEERVLRARLESRLDDVFKWDEAQQDLAARALREAEKAAERDARVARNLSRLAAPAVPIATRSTRARNRVNYDEDATAPGAGEDGTRKRRRVGDEDYAFEDGAAGDGMEEDGEGSSRGGRRGRGSTGPALLPNGKVAIPGERRSGRLARKDEGEAEDGGSVVGDSAAATPAPEQGEGNVEPATAGMEVEGNVEPATAGMDVDVDPSPSAAATDGNGNGAVEEPATAGMSSAAPAPLAEPATAGMEQARPAGVSALSQALENGAGAQEGEGEKKEEPATAGMA
ncbi:hypothetical protein JCM8547_008074 [Rhodosporidiobolus lusitaniae]